MEANFNPSQHKKAPTILFPMPDVKRIRTQSHRIYIYSRPHSIFFHFCSRSHFHRLQFCYLSLSLLFSFILFSFFGSKIPSLDFHTNENESDSGGICNKCTAVRVADCASSMLPMAHQQQQQRRRRRMALESKLFMCFTAHLTDDQQWKTSKWFRNIGTWR